MKEIFGQSSGFICIALLTGRNSKKSFQEHYFQYPSQVKEVHEYVQHNKYAGDIYFCAQLLTKPQRIKSNVVSATCVWADLDTCDPDSLLVRPSITLETSPNRYQAFWIFDEPRDATLGEDLARRITYRHASEGSDKSGWDLTQLLRVPSTYNFKYGDGPTAPEVKVVEHNQSRYRPSDFDQYSEAEGYEYVQTKMPPILYEDGVKILERYSFKISGAAHTLFREEATEGDRSQTLFRLEMLCAEAGMAKEDAFQIARDSTCNKWQDQPELLWRDICRAYSVHADNTELSKIQASTGPGLVSDEERRDIETDPCFVERYVNWAQTLGDAAVQYHQAAAFVALSALLSGSIQLPTSFGAIVPNIWVCLLAGTTISRKSTSMGIVMGLLDEVDSSLLMATDGSMEGFAQALSERPGRVSIFFKDEFTGMLESMMKKDYLAGMPEFFTDLYDGKTRIRRLRKEEVKIKDPRLIIFAGGIKSRMQQLVTFEHVSSGFLPRFIFVTAETDPTKVKPLGPPTEEDWGARDTIKSELQDIYSCYRAQVPVVHDDKVVGVAEKKIDATLTPDAWRRFNQIDQTLMHVGMDSGDLRDILTPLYARLGFSMLKASMLIAASRARDERVIVDESDIVRAAYYGERWRYYAQDIIANIGKGPMEHKVQLVANAIHKRKRVARSALMNQYHLQAQEMSMIIRTLDERGVINVTQRGKQQVYTSLLTDDEKKLKDIQPQ